MCCVCVCCNFRVRSGFVDVVRFNNYYGGVCKYLVSWLCL